MNGSRQNLSSSGLICEESHDGVAGDSSPDTQRKSEDATTVTMSDPREDPTGATAMLDPRDYQPVHQRQHKISLVSTDSEFDHIVKNTDMTYIGQGGEFFRDIAHLIFFRSQNIWYKINVLLQPSTVIRPP